MQASAVFGSLRSVLALQVVAPVLAVLALILTVLLGVLGQFVEGRMQRDLQLVARAVHFPVTQALARRDIGEIESSLASVFGMSEVYGAYLFDGEGNRVLSFGTGEPTRAQAGDALKLSREGQFEQYETIRGENVYSFFLPLFDAGGQPDGLLQVTRRRSDIEAELRKLQLRTWGGFGVAALVVFGLLGFTHRRAIGRPLEALHNSVQRIAAGEREHRVEPAGPLELRQLSQRFNSMLDAIDEAEAREAAEREERARVEAQLRRSETLAALGQLSAGVAHELGAPLSVVDGRARRLQRIARSEEETRELGEIRDQAARMTSIVQQLLAYARGARSGHEPLGVADLVVRVHALAADEGVAASLREGPPASVRGDALGLELALINLLRNARQACPAGAVEIGWQAEGACVVLRVDDAGPGVPEAERARVFEPFHTTRLPGEGTGLGLAIVQRIAREHGGEVRVSASPLGGARFELVLNAGETGHD
ncbi:MAG: HAMP domain-containing histidine kinase [Pseudazoarcus pumilus]|nr:HAMP domain-containing histidine kinase [Pseudazoarcus pumilus]